MLSVMAFATVFGQDDDMTTTFPYIACSSHEDCVDPTTPFCYAGSCAPCSECHYCDDGVDGTCGNCPADEYPTREDKDCDPTSVISCSCHDECPDSTFCFEEECAACDECHYCDDGIDGTCGTCPADEFPTEEDEVCEADDEDTDDEDTDNEDTDDADTDDEDTDDEDTDDTDTDDGDTDNEDPDMMTTEESGDAAYSVPMGEIGYDAAAASDATKNVMVYVLVMFNIGTLLSCLSCIYWTRQRDAAKQNAVVYE